MHGAFAYAKTDWMETKLEWEWWQSAAGILAFGITKECVDVAFGGQFDWKDVRADMIGWASFRMVHFKIQF